MSKRLYEESTVLELGARGRHEGAPFELVGRTCIVSDGGGLWNEWVMRFSGGRTCWLAEARGDFVVYDDASIFPDHGALVAGEAIPFVVVERGTGTRVAAWGDVPDAPKRYRYANLLGPTGEPVTLDWSTPNAHAFAGKKTTLSALGLSPRKRRRLLWPAPDVSKPKSVVTWLEIGDDAEFRGAFRVAGILARSMKVDGDKWSWVEYFLESPSFGFRWLSESEGHWSFVEPIDAIRGATLRATMKPLSSGTARVDWAEGELPWKVEIGETVAVSDWVAAPDIVSCESTKDEASWSLARYLPPLSMAKAFGTRKLPKPVGRAPNQPKR